MVFGAGAPKAQAVWCSLTAHPKFNDHFLKFASVKGGIISEGIFDLVQSSKKMNQNIVPQLELVSKELNHLAAILHVYAGGLNFMK